MRFFNKEILIMNIILAPDEATDWKNELLRLIDFNGTYSKEIINKSKELAEKYLKLESIHQNELKSGLGYLNFSNLPIDENLCSPPCNASRPYNKGYLSELILLGITRACGLNPFAYQEEKKGALIHDITPINKSNNKHISSEGILSFDFHTDGAYLPRHHRPHSLSLLCLEDRGNTPTNLVPLKEIIKDLSFETIQLLLKPNFVHTAPETFKVNNKKINSSILDLIDGNYEIKGALHSIEALNSTSYDALQNLRNAILKNTISKYWKKGDLIIFNNLTCMHGRGEVTDIRWLQRCYGTYTFPSNTIINIDSMVNA